MHLYYVEDFDNIAGRMYGTQPRVQQRGSAASLHNVELSSEEDGWL